MLSQPSQLTRRPAWMRLSPWLLVMILCAGYLTFVYLRFGRDTREFICPSSSPSAEPCYDGQFSYCLALDLSVGAKPCLDVPAYRYQRILLSLVARIVALGDSARIIWGLLAVNLAGLALGTWALEQLLLAAKANRWFALSYGLFGGVFFAVRVCTTEPFAYGLALLAIVAVTRERWRASAVIFALAAFTKETTLFFAAGAGLYYLLNRRWQPLVWLLIIVGGSFAAWQFYIRSLFGSFGIGSGGNGATPFEWIPFNGAWQILGANLPLPEKIRFFILPAVCIGLTLWLLWHSGRELLRQRFSLVACVTLINALVMLTVPFSTYREPWGIGRFMVGLVICLVWLAAVRRQRRALMYSTLLIIVGGLLVA